MKSKRISWKKYFNMSSWERHELFEPKTYRNDRTPHLGTKVIRIVLPKEYQTEAVKSLSCSLEPEWFDGNNGIYEYRIVPYGNKKQNDYLKSDLSKELFTTVGYKEGDRCFENFGIMDCLKQGR